MFNVLDYSEKEDRETGKRESMWKTRRSGAFLDDIAIGQLHVCAQVASGIDAALSAEYCSSRHLPL